jgi:dTDP-4-amino-4,6-dideoxygalactose transaminase
MHPNIQMVDLRGQYLKLKPQIDEAIANIINNTAFIGGKAVQDFAANLAQYLHSNSVIPCGNGTDALQIALMALNLQQGDEIITASHTFVATAEVIALLGLKPVFVDIDPNTFTIDTTQIEAAITTRTRVIIPVHLFGQSADMETIMAIAKKHNLYVIEDNAQAIGANYYYTNGTTQKTGTIGDIGCTSFYPSKNLGCYGDGGAVFTNNPHLAQQMHLIANHGQRVKYDSDVVGINSRLDGIQAVVLAAKLPHLDQYIVARQQAAAYYDAAFAQHPNIKIPQRANYSSHVFHQYTIYIQGNRDQLKQALEQKGIPTMIYYPIPVHLQKAYQYLGYKSGSLRHTEYAAAQTISLPMHTELTQEQCQYIADTVITLAAQIS